MNIKGLRTAKRTADEIKTAKEALNEAFLNYKSVGEIAADPKFVFEVGELVRQLATDTFALSDPTPLFVNRADADLGQTIELEETINTMKAVRRHPASHPLAFTPTKRKYPISTKQYDVPFFMDIERILRRQLEPSVFADHAAEAVSRVYVSTVLGAIDAAATGNDHYGRAIASSVATNLTDTVLDAALRSLGDVNENTFIAGRYYTLFPLTSTAAFTSNSVSDNTLDEIHRTGMIGRYKGAQVIILRDDFNWFYNEATIPANKVYIGGSDKGAWLHERDVSPLNYQVVDSEKAEMRMGFRLDFGVTVLQPWKYRVITIT